MTDITVQYLGGTPEEPTWKQHFDEDASAGYICRKCHALVPAYPDHAIAHLEWHDKAGH